MKHQPKISARLTTLRNLGFLKKYTFYCTPNTAGRWHIVSAYHQGIRGEEETHAYSDDEVRHWFDLLGQHHERVRKVLHTKKG